MSGWAKAGLLAALLGAGALRLSLARHRYFDTDELEHLHAALLVSHGNVPFRDFFEHHGPAFWSLIAPAAAAPADPYDKALAGRAVVSVFWLMSLALAARGRRGASPYEAPLAAAMLAWFGAFAQKSLEVRPDVPAAFLAAGAAWMIARPAAWSGQWAGLLFGAALWFSPKALFPGLGLALGAAWRRSERAGPNEALRLLGGFAAGAAAAGAAGALYFAAQGGLGKLWSYYVLYNAGFPGARVAWSATLLPSLLSDPLIWLAGLLGLRRWRERPEEAGALVFTVLGLAATPSAYPQHLLFAAPFLASFAAAEVLGWVRAAPARGRGLWSRGGRGALAAAALACSFAVTARTAWGRIGEGNALQRERWECASAHVPENGAVWDVWTGDAFHRPHASFLWFVPGDSQNYYEPKALEEQFIAGLASKKTVAAIRCESCLRRVPPSVVSAFDLLYEPTGCGRLWTRRKGT
ncbi:MAG: hypothetical protein M0D55_05625 [Elusimicrobiota bacterium]|nr:MAG: hypothetical protein M0D55_05625 [Elusimicrobiota bacterium]